MRKLFGLVFINLFCLLFISLSAYAGNLDELVPTFNDVEAQTIDRLYSSSIGADSRYRTGKTIAIQEATAASACSGTLTLTAATPVVVSTTCATTGSRIFLTRTSIDADTTGDMAVTALTDGVSFAVTSEANDTATVNWIIFHEAP